MNKIPEDLIKPVFAAPLRLEVTRAVAKTNESLISYVRAEVGLESDEKMAAKDMVLKEVENIFLGCVKEIGVMNNIPEEVAESAGGEIFVSGSHKLQLRDIGSDIDAVCVAPNFVTKDAFFEFMTKVLDSNSHVTNLIPVPRATVPVISFDYDGTSIDMLFVRFTADEVPKDLNILDDNILVGMSRESVMSMNGPRVTNILYEIVRDKFEDFQCLVRCVRKWAKAKGLYGNKMGYLGGVNVNLMCAFICQLYPESPPVILLDRFFSVYSRQEWPKPIQLNKIRDHPSALIEKKEQMSRAGEDVRELMQTFSCWHPNDIKMRSNYNAMPVITPAYPAFNSLSKVNIHTRNVMQHEFTVARDKSSKILASVNPIPELWREMFEPSDFFIRYRHYLQCRIVLTGDDASSRAWLGTTEAGLLFLTQHIEHTESKVSFLIHLFPISFKSCENDMEYIYYYFGIDVAPGQVMPSVNEINIDTPSFVDGLKQRYNGEKNDKLDFEVHYVSFKNLPEEVFTTLGGKQRAKELRNARGYCKKSVWCESMSSSTLGTATAATATTMGTTTTTAATTTTSVSGGVNTPLKGKIEGNAMNTPVTGNVRTKRRLSELNATSEKNQTSSTSLQSITNTNSNKNQSMSLDSEMKRSEALIDGNTTDDVDILEDFEIDGPKVTVSLDDLEGNITVCALMPTSTRNRLKYSTKKTCLVPNITYKLEYHN